MLSCLAWHSLLDHARKGATRASLKKILVHPFLYLRATGLTGSIPRLRALHPQTGRRVALPTSQSDPPPPPKHPPLTAWCKLLDEICCCTGAFKNGAVVADADLEALNSAPSFNAWGLGLTRSRPNPAGSAAIDLATSSSSGLGKSRLLLGFVRLFIVSMRGSLFGLLFTSGLLCQWSLSLPNSCLAKVFA